MAERIAIVGARDASPETLAKVRELVESLPDGTIVVSGGAPGVDFEAAMAASGRLSVVEYRVGADRVFRDSVEPSGAQRHSVVAHLAGTAVAKLLLLRNSFIALDSDRMVAFVEGSKGGTWDAVAQAKRFRRPCEVRR